MIAVERWMIADDWPGAACSECAALAGKLFAAGEGPYPPLHPRCRCRREPVRFLDRLTPIEMIQLGALLELTRSAHEE